MNTINLNNIQLIENSLDDYQRFLLIETILNSKKKLINSYKNDNNDNNNKNKIDENEPSLLKLKINQTAYKSKLIKQIKDTCNDIFSKKLQQYYYQYNNQNQSQNNVSQNRDDELKNLVIKFKPKGRPKNLLNCSEIDLPNIIFNNYNIGNNDNNSYDQFDSKTIIKDQKFIEEIDDEMKRKFCINDKSHELMVGKYLLNHDDSQIDNSTPNGSENDKNNENTVFTITKNQQYKLTNINYIANIQNQMFNPNNALIWSKGIQYVYISGIWKLYQDIMFGLMKMDRCREAISNELMKNTCKLELIKIFNYLMPRIDIIKHIEKVINDGDKNDNNTIPDTIDHNDKNIENDKNKKNNNKYIEFYWNYLNEKIQNDLLTYYKKYLTELENVDPDLLNDLNDLNFIQRLRGGFIRIQGIWLPIEFARPLCILFAFPIRYFLVPIFGDNFPKDCENWFNNRDKFNSIAQFMINYSSVFQNNVAENEKNLEKNSSLSKKTFINNKTSNLIHEGQNFAISNVSNNNSNDLILKFQNDSNLTRDQQFLYQVNSPLPKNTEANNLHKNNIVNVINNPNKNTSNNEQNGQKLSINNLLVHNNYNFASDYNRINNSKSSDIKFRNNSINNSNSNSTDFGTLLKKREAQHNHVLRKPEEGRQHKQMKLSTSLSKFSAPFGSHNPAFTPIGTSHTLPNRFTFDHNTTQNFNVGDHIKKQINKLNSLENNYTIRYPESNQISRNCSINPINSISSTNSTNSTDPISESKNSIHSVQSSQSTINSNINSNNLIKPNKSNVSIRSINLSSSISSINSTNLINAINSTNSINSESTKNVNCQTPISFINLKNGTSSKKEVQNENIVNPTNGDKNFSHDDNDNDNGSCMNKSLFLRSNTPTINFLLNSNKNNDDNKVNNGDPNSEEGHKSS